MTETAAPTTSAPRLDRQSETPFLGVCDAIGRATGTDPLMWRILVIVLTLFHGLGILLYALGVALIPAADKEHSFATRLIHGPDRRPHGGEWWLLLVLAIGGIGYVSNASGIIVVAVAAVVGLFWWRGRHEAPAVAQATASAPVERPVWTPPPSLPPRPHSPLGGITVSLAAIVAGVLVLVGVTGTHVPLAVPIAGALGVVGLGLVAGSFFGRSWGLFWLAGLLTVALGVAAAVQPLLDDGVGERAWSPSGSASYRLGAGDGVLDLSRVRPSADITAHVGYGRLTVEVPKGMALDVDARAEYGDVELYGKGVGGRHEHQSLSEPDATVHLHLSVRAGEVRVVRQ
ncbi:MAG: PspC domain-containing protein [Mycobacteriales bacterium]